MSGYTFLVCPDAALARREADRVLADTGSTELKIFYGDEPLPGEFWRALSSVSLLGGSAAVLLRRAEKLNKAAWSELSPVLAAGPSGWAFVCLEGEFKRGKPDVPKVVAATTAWKRAQERGLVWASPGLAGGGLAGYVREGLARRGVRAAGPVVQQLTAALPAEAQVVDSELDKLALAVDGPDAELSPQHLELLSSPPGLDFWQLFTVLTEGGDTRALWREVLDPQAAGSGGSGLLFKLLRTMERELPALGLLAEGRGDEVKLPAWLKDKKARLARRMAPGSVSRLYGLLLEAERGVKSGSVTEAQALERLVAGIAATFSPGPQQGRSYR